MNETTRNKRVFADGLWVKQKTFDDGGSILCLAVVADKLSKFLNEHKSESGFVNLVIREKQFPDAKSTHICYLDEWKPTIPKKSPPKESVEPDNSLQNKKI